MCEHPEDWEAHAIATSENEDSAQRYKLKVKFEGIHLRDIDAEYDEKRRIVGLEWSKRDRGSGRAACWSVVTQLVAKYHEQELTKAQEEDADTDPLETTSQPYMINDDLYSMIIVAKQEDQPCTIKEAADKDSDADAMEEG